MKRFISKGALILASLAFWGPTTANAAEYPEKPIVVVLPFGAGGSHDLHARGITSIMADIIGQPMIVKLLPGAAGMKATGFVANAKPDGYTLLFTSNGIDMIIPQVSEVPFDTQKEFKTVARINKSEVVMLTRGDSDIKTLDDFIAAAKANPGEINVAHSGVWGASYTGFQTLAKAAGIKVNLIPHKGGGPMLRAVLAGRVDVGFSGPQAISHLESGELRGLAVMGKERLTEHEATANIPSLWELGYPDTGFTMERIFMAPSETPPERLEFLRDAFTQLQENDTFKKYMESIGMPIQFARGDEYDKIRPQEFSRLGDLIKTINE